MGLIRTFLPKPLHEPALKLLPMTRKAVFFGYRRYCPVCRSHVLEHVPDDMRAMRQLCRVLKHGGCAIVTVPITAKQTFQDPSVTTPAERKRIYGRHDHLRRYGPDVEQRLNRAGFDVQCARPQDFIAAEDIAKMRIADESIFLCRKPQEKKA